MAEDDAPIRDRGKKPYKRRRGRYGQNLASHHELVRKTALHAGVPIETANYIVTAFLDVLFDEAVTNGGFVLKGLFTLHPTKNSSTHSSMTGYYPLSPIKAKVTVAKTLQTIYQMQTVFCREGERIVTPGSWRGFSAKYWPILTNNRWASGVIASTKGLKDGADPLTKNEKDRFPLDEPLANTWFGRLIREMNHSGLFDVKYHKDSIEELTSGDNRLMYASDVNEHVYPYVKEHGAERIGWLTEKQRNGEIGGRYLADNIKSPMREGIRQKDTDDHGETPQT